jgi:hypothetical protein
VLECGLGDGIDFTVFCVRHCGKMLSVLIIETGRLHRYIVYVGGGVVEKG